MGQKMVYLETALLQHYTGLAAYTAPGTIYFIASTGVFDPTLDGTSVIEPVGGSYARVSAANSSSTWNFTSGGNPVSTSNIVQINFPTASADWGTIQAVYAADAATLGNLLYGTAVAGAGVPIANLSTFQIPIGAFVIRET